MPADALGSIERFRAMTINGAPCASNGRWSGYEAGPRSGRRRPPPPVANCACRHRRRALTEHRARQDGQRAAAGSTGKSTDWSSRLALGTLLDPANLRRGLRHVTESAGLGRWHLHELRHSAASLLSAAGVPLEEIADVLEHRHTGDRERLRHRTTPTVEAAVTTVDRLFDPPQDR